jgi:tetratricopeptide (TPR) repeat protein
MPNDASDQDISDRLLGGTFFPASGFDSLGRGLYLGGWSPGEYSASNEFKSADFGVGSSCRKQEGCMSKFAIRLLTLAMFSMALVAAPLVTKVHANPDSDAPPPSSSKSKAKKKTSEVSPSIEDAAFAKGYRAAYATIYDRNDYAAAIEQLKALGHDDSAAVANLIGYSYRKLGDYKVSQIWYERALKADPNHVKTWQYYGLWQVEQGNRDQAQYHLSRIAALAGTNSEEYRSLAAALEKPPGTGLVY